MRVAGPRDALHFLRHSQGTTCMPSSTASPSPTSGHPTPPRGFTRADKLHETLSAIRNCTYYGLGKYLAATTHLARPLGISQPGACERRNTLARQTGAVVAGRFITLPMHLVPRAERRREERAARKLIHAQERASAPGS